MCTIVRRTKDREQPARQIALSGRLVEQLKHHKRVQNERRLRLGEKYQKLDLVFATAAGGPIHRDNLNVRNFKPICKRAELETNASLYTLRHTCATLLLLAGEHPKVVSERLGHSSISITLDVYSHVLPTMQHAATSKLEQMLYVAAK